MSNVQLPSASLGANTTGYGVDDEISPKVVPIRHGLNFDVNGDAYVDLSTIYQNGGLSVVQSMYVDNSFPVPSGGGPSGPGNIEVWDRGAHFMIGVNLGTQGFYPVPSPPGGPGYRIHAPAVASAALTPGTYLLNLFFFNIRIPFASWLYTRS